MSDPVDDLARALDQAGRALDGVGPGNVDLSTHLEGWTVRDLADHVAASPARFVQMARGEQVDWAAPSGIEEGGWSAAFREGADELLTTMRDLPPDQRATAGFATAEFAVHSWDLARGTGADVGLDEGVAETALTTMRQGLTDENRVGAFAPEVPVPADASPYERLAGFSGRDPRP